MSIHETIWVAPSWMRRNGLDSMVELTVKSVTAKRIMVDGSTVKAVDRQRIEESGWVWIGSDIRPGSGTTPTVVGLTRDDCRRGVVEWHRQHAAVLSEIAATHAATADSWEL